MEPAITTPVVPSGECYEVKAGMVSLQCNNCVIHRPTWALQRRASHNEVLYKSSFLLLPYSSTAVDVIVLAAQVIMPVTQWAGSANSCVNPFIYCFFSNKFRAGFKHLFVKAGCRCWCCRRCCPPEEGWTRHWDPATMGATCITAAPYRRENAAAEREFPSRRGAVKRATVNQFTTCATVALGIAAAGDLTFEATSLWAYQKHDCFDNY